MSREVMEKQRVGVCEVHYLVGGVQTLRPTTFQVDAWVCEECRHDPQKRVQAVLIRARLEDAQASVWSDLQQRFRERKVSPDDEVLLWELAFGGPDDDFDE